MIRCNGVLHTWEGVNIPQGTPCHCGLAKYGLNPDPKESRTTCGTCRYFAPATPRGKCTWAQTHAVPMIFVPWLPTIVYTVAGAKNCPVHEAIPDREFAEVDE